MSWSIKKSKEMPICNYAVAQSTSNGLKKWSICYRSNGWIIAAEWNITSSKSTALTRAIHTINTRWGLSMSSGDSQSFAARLCFHCAHSHRIHLSRSISLPLQSLLVRVQCTVCTSTQMCLWCRIYRVIEHWTQREAKFMYAKQLCVWVHINHTKCDCYACKLQIINHLWWVRYHDAARCDIVSVWYTVRTSSGWQNCGIGLQVIFDTLSLLWCGKNREHIPYEAVCRLLVK